MQAAEVNIRRCGPSDLDELQKFAWQTFDESFGRFNTPENMQAYLNTAFDKAKLEMELKNPDSSFFFLFVKGMLAGYLKINENSAQTDIGDSDSLEIERIYVKSGFQGRGLGKALIQKALEVARQKNKSYAWLGVWEKNEKAIAFYERMGFKTIETHDFYLGDDRQTDYIMKQELV